MTANYYEILGINESASKDEIKTRYRKLAMQYHPDRNHGDKACEEKFKTILEAYSTLSDEKKKSDYDFIKSQRSYQAPKYNYNQTQYQEPRRQEPDSGAQNVRSGFGKKTENVNDFKFRQYEQEHSQFAQDFYRSNIYETFKKNTLSTFKKYENPAGSHIKISVDLTLDEILNGYKNSFKFEKYQQCEKCKGQGYLKENFYCDCEECNGKGRVMKPFIFDMKLPSRFFENRLIYKEKGDLGSAGHKNGNLIVELNLKKHNKFNIIDNNIFSEERISVKQAVMGTQIVVKTLLGEKKLDIHSGTVNGEIFIIKEYGLRNRQGFGDHFVEIRIDPNIEDVTNIQRNKNSLMGILENDISSSLRNKLLKRKNSKRNKT